MLGGACVPFITEHSPVVYSWHIDQSVVMALHYKRKLASVFFCEHEHSYLEGNMTGVFCSLRKTQVASPLSHRVLTVFGTKCESLLWSKPHVQSESRLGISWNRLASMAPVGSSCLASQYSCTQGPHLSKICLKLLPSILNSILCRGVDCWVFIAAFVSFWNVDLPSGAKKLD